MRGLDDALDRLARRDQLRRRAAGESAGTPPAVTELVEAIAAVVGRNPSLAVTVGVEGAGEPTLLHFAVEDGIVQVSADNSVAQRAGTPGGAEHPHGDVIDVDLDEPGYHHYEPPAPQPHPFAATPPPEVPPQTPRPAYEEQHRAHIPEQRGMPAPLPEPIPLEVNEEETEMAARRLSALLREDPGLLGNRD
ncbi:hypothetical protein [Actinoplanes sp. TFC3]|uniref:hypothetical protein n=1 Tax=Actinoplanes sp. TFC3 TaxID=1710355 RepID=UPI000835F5C0|nr:hypothetical protein [Actinoplanes sp. TFC3]